MDTRKWIIYHQYCFSRVFAISVLKKQTIYLKFMLVMLDLSANGLKDSGSKELNLKYFSSGTVWRIAVSISMILVKVKIITFQDFLFSKVILMRRSFICDISCRPKVVNILFSSSQCSVANSKLTLTISGFLARTASSRQRIIFGIDLTVVSSISFFYKT